MVATGAPENVPKGFFPGCLLSANAFNTRFTQPMARRRLQRVGASGKDVVHIAHEVAPGPVQGVVEGREVQGH